MYLVTFLPCQLLFYYSVFNGMQGAPNELHKKDYTNLLNLTMISDTSQFLKISVVLTQSLRKVFVERITYSNGFILRKESITRPVRPTFDCFSSPGYSTMSPQEDSENPPGNNDPLSAGVDVGNHDDDLDLDTPPQTAALLSHKFHPYRHTHTHHHPLHTHTHHLQAAVTVHSVDAEC